MLAVSFEQRQEAGLRDQANYEKGNVSTLSPDFEADAVLGTLCSIAIAILSLVVGFVSIPFFQSEVALTSSISSRVSEVHSSHSNECAKGTKRNSLVYFIM